MTRDVPFVDQVSDVLEQIKHYVAGLLVVRELLQPLEARCCWTSSMRQLPTGSHSRNLLARGVLSGAIRSGLKKSPVHLGRVCIVSIEAKGRIATEEPSQSSASGPRDVSRLASMATSATPAAATKYHAGASLLPVAWISQVATNGAVPPNRALAALKQNAKPL